MRLKMKNGSHRYDINRTNPRRGHKYTNFVFCFFLGGGDSLHKMGLSMMMIMCNKQHLTLREKCPYSELCWSAFSRIRTEYGEILQEMRENTDQNNSKYGHFLRSVSNI